MIVEREKELSELRTHLGAVLDSGRGRVVLVGGEAGIGKTTLLDTFVDGLGPRVPVLRGWCDPVEAPRPLGPLVDMLSPYANSVAGRVDAAIEAADVHALHDVLLATMSESRGLCVVEDAHWADGATLTALGVAARRITVLPSLLVISYRDDALGRMHPLRGLLGDLAGQPGVHRIDMTPWSPLAVRQVARGSGVDPDHLHEVTGGNPFYVTEVLAGHVSESGGSHPLPRTVIDAVGGRLRRLSTQALGTVHGAAVCGSGVHVDLLGAVSPDAPTTLMECVEAGVLLQDGNTVRFRHEVIREATLAQVDAYTRAHLHRRALGVLTRPPVRADSLAALVHHAEGCGDDDAVGRYGPAAADHAFALGAHRQAESLYALCLRLAGEAPPELVVLWTERRGVCQYLAGQPELAAQSMTQAVEQRHRLADTENEGENRRWLSHALFASGQPTLAIEAAESSVAVLSPLGPSRSLGLSLVNVAELAAMTFDPRCRSFADDAIAVADQLGDHSVVVRARGYAALATVLATDTGWEDLEAAWRDAMEHPELAAHGGVTGAVLAWTAALHHRLDDTEGWIEITREHCRAHDLPMFGALLDATAALANLHRGRWTEALDDADRVLTQPHSTALHRLLPLTCTALIRARRGQPAVQSLLDEARANAEPGDLFRLGVVYAADAEVAWLAGDDTASRDAAQRALSVAPDAADPWITGRLHRWLRLTGTLPQRPEAHADGSRRTPFDAEIAGDWQAAAQMWLGMGCPYDAALARLGGDVSGVVQARDDFEALGLRAAVRRAEQRLRQMGAGDRCREKAAPSVPLTQREEQVLTLLTSGHSDAAIAAALFVSPKTVNRHVGSILSKLGVHNRTQAAVHALARQVNS